MYIPVIPQLCNSSDSDHPDHFNIDFSTNFGCHQDGRCVHPDSHNFNIKRPATQIRLTISALILNPKR